MQRLAKLRLAGWKSVRAQEIEFRSVNVIIGANGAGKSNLVSFFDLLHETSVGRIDEFVAAAGGANALLFFGTRETQAIVANLEFADPTVVANLRLIPTAQNRLADARTSGPDDPLATVGAFASARAFHFHDTTPLGPLRRDCEINANPRLFADGSNLPAMLYLYRERHAVAYHRIVAAVRSVASFFDDFVLQPLRLNPSRIELRWRAKGREYDFGPHQLSDGTLRIIALFTLLLAPAEDRPGLIVLDEPELGLHPSAITILADLIHGAARDSQIIIATQSTALVDHFEPEDILVVNSRNGESAFERLDPARLEHWLEEYSIGELWEKNVIGGGPY